MNSRKIMSARKNVDYRCYLVTSGADQHTITVAAAAASAGVGIVQVRAKELSERARLELLIAVSRAVAVANPNTRVVVDDAVAVAAAAIAQGEAVHGVHLGQDDLPVSAARQILGQDALIGLTTGTLALVQQAQALADEVDYLGCGPFRPTPTKDSGRVPLGVAGYRPIAAASKIPVLAIGDVTPADVADLAGTGIAGVCMVRALMNAAEPQALVRQILRDWDAHRK